MPVANPDNGPNALKGQQHYMQFVCIHFSACASKQPFSLSPRYIRLSHSIFAVLTGAEGQ